MQCKIIKKCKEKPRSLNKLSPRSSESSGIYCRVLNWMSTDVSEAARTSETSVDIQFRTRQYIPEDSELHTSRRENLKSHTTTLTTSHHPADWGSKSLWNTDVLAQGYTAQHSRMMSSSWAITVFTSLPHFLIWKTVNRTASPSSASSHSAWH
jgi:hypothetical protein